MDKLAGLFSSMRGSMPKGGVPGGPPVSRAASGGMFAVVGLGTAAYTFYESLFNVDGGERAIIFNRFGGINMQGDESDGNVRREGTHFAIPWFQRPIIFNVKNRPNSFTSKTGSKDLQMVDITIRVLTKPNKNKLPQIYVLLGKDGDQEKEVLPSIVPEVLKAVVANYNAAQLITQRTDISTQVEEQLRESLHKFHIELDDVSLTSISFGAKYSAAVERKQIAQQDAEKAKHVVDKAYQTKKSRIIQAKAEAEAANQISQAMQGNPGYLELKRIERAREVAQVIAKSPNRVYLNSDNLLFNLGAEAMASNESV